MATLRKRQNVSSACQRCRQRKHACDRERPCHACTRAGVECIPRQGRNTIADSVDGINLRSARLNHANEPVATDPIVLPESNIIDLSRTIFGNVGSSPLTLGFDTSALPGGSKLGEPASPHVRTWRNLVEVQLPTDDVLEDIIGRFFASVDWFMMVFDEAAFKERYLNLVSSHELTHQDDNFQWLCILVIALGAHYLSLSPSSNRHITDFRQLSQELLTTIETRFLQIIGSSTLETVQICILLGSFLLFNGRPNAGLGISASGVKIAQVIGLHRESLWRDRSQVVIEERRRTWWALEVFDKYAAIAFGRPCIIDDSDCDVGMVSVITIDGQTSMGSELLQYHQWKFRLYRIMGPFLARQRQSKRLEASSAIQQQLLQWRRSLPQALRLEGYAKDSEDVTLLQMQALNLQLTYDNLQIILHRTVAFSNGSENPGASKVQINESIKQILTSATDTSELYQYVSTLRASRRTHADMHVGITLFTAGVVLCAICLLRPMTEMSSKAKLGIMHIIAMCRDATASCPHLISSQSLAILDSLVTVILQRENNLIIGRPESGAEPRPSIHESTTAIPSENLNEGFTSEPFTERPLAPIQELLAQHTSHPTSNVRHEYTNPLTMEPSDGNMAPNFNWDGDLSLLVDSGLADASQMWLWADNLDFDSFDNPDVP